MEKDNNQLELNFNKAQQESSNNKTPLYSKKTEKRKTIKQDSNNFSLPEEFPKSKVKANLLKAPQELEVKAAFDENSKEALFFLNLINLKTVSEILGVAPKTIHNWVYLRKIPYVKIGRKVMFRPKSLALWFNRKEIKSWL